MIVPTLRANADWPSIHTLEVHFLVAVLALAPVSDRASVNLDAGWEFARVPSRPSIWRGADAVPTSLWRVLKVSSEETTREKAPASQAFDGDPNTFWHTEWSRTVAPYPHELVIDLGAETDVVGLRLLPRQPSPQNGRPNHFQLYLGETAQSLTQPVLEDAVPDGTALCEKRFAPTKCHFMRLVFLDGHKQGEPFLALSEIGLIRNTDISDHKDWKSQYDITSIEQGDRRFDLQPDDLANLSKAELSRVKHNDWNPATLPHAAWVRPLNTPEIWQGVTYYRRHLMADPSAKHAELEIDGVMQSADLWLNGKHIASHRGGYLPLIVDLTGKLHKSNELLLRVDNSDNPLIPPGKPQSQLDFMYGSGITRHASLTQTESLYITNPLAEGSQFGGGVAVIFPNVAASQATVRVRSFIRSADTKARNFKLRQSILDSTGRMVATVLNTYQLQPTQAQPFFQGLTVQHPRVWSPDHPNLYRLRTEILDASNLVDRTETQIGIRTITVSRAKGMLINGQPIRLIGTNRHQDYPWIGPALSDNANRRDALLIKRSGHNIVRLSHYPQSPAFLQACDEFGILTIPCIPGWQFINRDPRFAALVKRDIQQLIRRDRNHPSVAYWEASLNETYPGEQLADEWNAIAKAESLDGKLLTAGDGTKGAPWDVIYNTWLEDLSRPQDAFLDRPGYIREYGDYEFGGATSSSRAKRSQGMDALLQETWNHVWSYNKFRPQYPWTMGAGTWEMFDHNVPWDFAVSASGLADIMRLEKPSFWFYRSQVETKPYLKIASTWQPGLPTRTVIVFTNCDRAQLKLNGRTIRTQSATRGISTSYSDAKLFDGSNTQNLSHPPIVFRNIPYVPGSLEAIGIRKGAPASDRIRTANKPARLKVWLDDLGIAPNRNDRVFIRAAVVDARGTICPSDTRRIQFSIGGGNMVGESSAPCEMGISSTLAQTPASGGRITVRADGGHLTGFCSFGVK